MANPLISGTFAGLTNVNVRGVQDTITDSVDQFNWEFAWKKFKMDNPNYKVNDSDIPTLCKQLSKNQVDVLFKNAVNNAKFEVVKIVTEKVTPHLDTLAKGATDAGAAVMDAFGEARDAAKMGATKIGETGKKVIGAFVTRGQEFGNAFQALGKKKKVDITLSSFEIFILAQMGIFKSEGINTYRHISMGPMKNGQVYKVLYYIYSQNEPLLFMLHEMYKKIKQEAFQKKMQEYKEKKDAYEKSVAKYKGLVAQEALNVEKDYNEALKKHEEDKALYGVRLKEYEKCRKSRFRPRQECEAIKPVVPISPVKRNTRKIVSPKKLSSATPVQKMSNFGVNSGPKKSEKVKALSAAIKQNSASASRRNRGSTRRRRS